MANEPTNPAATVLTGGTEPTPPTDPKPANTEPTEPTPPTEPTEPPQVPEGYIALPAENATPEELDAFYAKLGRPESADKYGVTLQNDTDGAAGKAFMDAAFKAGLTPAQAATIAEASNAFTEQQVQAYAAEQDRQMKALQTDWGADYDKNTEIARQAVRKFGLSDDEVVRLESALGSNALMKFMHKIGSAIADPDIKGAGGAAKPSGTPVYTKAEAQAKLNTLMADQEFGKKFLAKDKEAVKLFNDLNHIIATGGN